MSIDEIYERVDFDKMNDTHMEMIHLYAKLLDKNGVLHKF